MSIKREFIDWKLSAIPATVEYLFRRYRRPGLLDMSHVIIVAPGSRAGRRLLDQLLERAENEQLMLFPPTVETVSVFPEQLYQPKRPFASDLTQLLAWVRALQQVDKETLSCVVPHPPADSDFLGWLDLARVLRRLHAELAADALNFEHVIRSGEKLADFAEIARWKALQEIQLGYLRVLDSQQLWDQQTARLFAIEHHECQTQCDIVLAGAVDLNQAVRKMLDQVHERVVALIFAPQKLADRFDSHGCLIPSAWSDVEINVPRDQIIVAGGPSQQADEVLNVLREYGGRYRIDQITIGVPDQRLLPVLERRLAEQDIATRWVFGKKLKDTAPYRLIEAIREYIEGGRFHSFGSLVRHPDIFDWLAPLTQAKLRANPDAKDWLTQLDEYHSVHLQNRLGQWLGDAHKFSTLQDVYKQVREALRPLLTEDRMALTDWAVRLADVLSYFYDSKEVDRDSPDDQYLLAAFREIREGLLAFQSIPKDLLTPVDVLTAMKLLLEQMQDKELTSRSVPNSIEMLGWLELPLDTAPALVVTSINDGLVPSYQNSDLFLPNQLRRALGLADNSRRYARDAYALEVLLRSRESVKLIVGRTDADHYPLLPSRLLFACKDHELATRVQSFFDEPIPAPHRHRVIGNSRERSEIYVPKPAPLSEPIQSVSVTAFRTYLDCPYRFYLRHVLRLTSLADDMDEMDALSFGSLAHRVLEKFAQHRNRDSQDAAELRLILRKILDAVADQQFGDDRMPAVDVQLMQLEQRLEAFAEWQANWSAQGWRIHAVEVEKFPGNPAIAVGNRSLGLRGRIDRIDYHPTDNLYAVFDYKTSDAVKSPHQTHCRGGAWIDLQLPLYRVLARSFGITAPLKLGYILLPKDPRKVGDDFATWSEQELQVADREAQRAAEGILDQSFWPPRTGGFRDEFAAICQDNVLGRTLP